jgi:hypothetical protein
MSLGRSRSRGGRSRVGLSQPCLECAKFYRREEGIYLYRRSGSRVYIRESMLELDDFYKRWQASIYDLDKADRLKRKAVGEERMADWFAVDNAEQHPAIGGPDTIG